MKKQGSGKAKAPKTLQQVLVKVEPAKYRRVKTILISMDSTVASFVRAQFDQLIEDHKE